MDGTRGNRDWLFDRLFNIYNNYFCYHFYRNYSQFIQWS